MIAILRATPLALIACVAIALAADAPAKKTPPKSAKEALGELNSIIGGWRGTALPRRGSNAGGWFETAEWVWDFSQPEPAVRYVVDKGQLIKLVRITYDLKASAYRATAELADGKKRDYQGQWTDGKLTLASDADPAGETHRITVTPLNKKRTLVLFEKGRAGSTLLSRVAEVGYTREGTRLAVEGVDGPECVVTGGRGTIAVSHKGLTYYVCCTGCQQAFDDDPEQILADYKARVAERKKQND